MQPQTGHRPQSTYANPVELGTTAYESPSGHQPHSAYSSSVYSQEDPYSATIPPNHQPAPTQYAAYVPPQQGQQPSYEPVAPASQLPPPSQQRYNAYGPPQQHQQPAYDPPAAPVNVPSPLPMNAGYPVLGQDARHTLPSQSQYKPYQRPGSSEERRSSGGAGGAPGGPSDFYKQSAAY